MKDGSYPFLGRTKSLLAICVTSRTAQFMSSFFYGLGSIDRKSFYALSKPANTNVTGRCVTFALLAYFSLALGSFLSGPAVGQEAGESFYKGKTIQMVIGSTPGGGYDLYGRLVARHLSKHVPGQPNVIASNMGGAASIVATQHIANSAAKDGTVIAAIYPGAIMEPLLGEKKQLKYDPSRLGYIGSANSEVYVCVVRGDAGVENFGSFINSGIVLGASAAGGSTRDFPALLTNLLGANFKIVRGYPGSSEILMAIDKGEVQGACGIGWSTIAVQRGQWIKTGYLRVMAQEGLRNDPALDALKVPMAISFAKNEQQRAIMNMHYAPLMFGRPFIVAAEVPTDRLNILREAFRETMDDPDLKEEARKMRLDLSPMGGEAAQQMISDLFKAPEHVLQSAKEAIIVL